MSLEQHPERECMDYYKGVAHGRGIHSLHATETKKGCFKALFPRPRVRIPIRST